MDSLKSTVGAVLSNINPIEVDVEFFLFSSTLSYAIAVKYAVPVCFKPNSI